jgi:TRAP-type transport system periplasmic protein
MMKKIRLGVSSCFVLTLLFAAIILISVTPAQAKTYNLTYSTFFPPTHIQAKLSEAWAKEIAKRTKGQVQIKIFTSGSLTPPPQAYDGVVRGISDFAECVLAYSPGRFPVLAAADNPLGYPNAYVATGVVNGLYDKFKPKEMSDVHVCYLFGHGPGLIHTTDKPVHTVEDMKGLKIRATGTSQAIVRALGAAPVAMSQGETYNALRKNIVNGTLVPMEALEGFKQAEVLKYTTLSYCIGYTQGFCVIMNLNKWKSLPKNLQDIITAVNKEYVNITAKAWEDSDKSGRKFAAKLGHEFITLTPEEQAQFKAAVRPVMDEYVKKANAQGVDGAAALKTAEELVKELSKKYK